MSEFAHQESPLVERNTSARRERTVTGAGVRLRERAFPAMVNLRGNPEDPEFLQAVRQVTGVELPRTPNTVVSGETVRALWLGPDEWYLVAEAGTENELVSALAQALAGQHHAVNDQTSGHATLVLAGPNARDVLEKGCTLDLHPRAFEHGQCAQSMIAHAGVVIRPLEEADSFELIVRRSFADYLWVWLEDAAAEFGLLVEA